MMDVDIKDKILLTVEEASKLSGIGYNRLNAKASEPTCPFVIWIGKRRKLIQRRTFEEWLNRNKSF